MKTIDQLLRPEVATPVGQPDDFTYGLSPTPRHRLLEPFRDSTFTVGFLLLLVSAGAFGLYELLGGTRPESGDNSLMVMLHYGLFIAYGIILMVNGHLGFFKAHASTRRPARWLGLLLWLISAYALNRNLAVFQQSTAWLCWALVGVGITMFIYAWKEVLPVRAQQVLYVGLAFGFCLFAYMAVYVVPLYLISVPLLIALGLSSHTFVPLTFAIVLGKRIWRDSRREEHLRPGVAVGLAVPVITLVVFLTSWVGTVNRIERTRMEATTRNTTDLPEWVLVAQQLKPAGVTFDWITNRLLLAGRTFDRGRFFESTDWGLSGLTALDDVKQHDPLVVIASQLVPHDALPDVDELKLIKTVIGQRHGTEEKFWTGRHLTTQNVVSQVRIWPQFRLSYTEKTIQIRNQARNTTEEALLTFHLPAGSVVSSMSLWVNGNEQPAYLTTVAKADSAYRQIVNVESRAYARDPSVVTWQEGNRVTVRVFPCRAGEDRRVKVGITSPLRMDGGQLVYQNPYFEGPNVESADELVKIDFAQKPAALQTPWLLDRLTNNTLTHEGRYKPDWILRLAPPALSPEPFVLDGRAYQMVPHQPTVESFRPTDVYLDVNAAWEKDEFTTAFWTAAHRSQRVWVFDDGLKRVSEADLDDTYERLTEPAFSLFPVYRIPNPATALLITKGTPASPTLSDLKDSAFADRMQRAAKQAEPIRTFCFGNELSPYLKTLAELRVLNVAHGTIEDLIGFDQKGQFPRQSDESNRIVLPEAAVAIRELPASLNQASIAPDHLARLFAYNHLLAQIGRHYFTPNYQTDSLIRQAQRAHIVSPLSSLVVLETAADYDRFSIQKDFSGLDNATLKQEGAVPEPHEWAMLMMAAGLVGWLYWRNRYGLA